MKTKPIILLLVVVALICGAGIYHNTRDFTTSNRDSQTTLIWWYSDDVPSQYEETLNQMLKEKGRDYSVQIQKVTDYEDGYRDQLIRAMQSGEPLDIFSIGSQFEGNTVENKYEMAVGAGLLAPLDDYLTSDEGKAFYDAYLPQQWESLTIQGHIYSYDWRTMPVQDLCVFINQEYIDKYKLTVDDTINLEDLFKMANEVAEQENDSALYPLYWALGSENDAEEQEWNLESLATLKKQYPNVLRYYDVERTTPFHYFAKFQTDNYVSNNDTQIVDYLPEEKTQTTVIKRTVKQGAFVSATNGLTGVASWSEHKAEAMDFLMLANTDADIATILQFGQENTDYKRENGRIADCDQLINYFSIGNKWITPPFGLEPDNKEEAYRSYLQEHLESSWEG